MKVAELTTDQAALLASILAAPKDDAPRLVFADWLDENGEGERAEFVRVQVELARYDEMTFAECRACECPDGDYPHADDCPRSPKHPLREREWELWGYLPVRHGVLRRFSDGLPGWAVLLNGDKGNGLTNNYPWAIVRRGFVAEVRVSCAAFMGGPCGRCKGRGSVCLTCRTSVGHGSDQCPVCKGEKVTPGVAGELFRSQPVTQVGLVGSEPARWPREDGGSDRVWVCPTENQIPVESDLPRELFQLLEGGQLNSDGWARRYPSAEAAHAALSIAACRLGRARAGVG